MVTVSLLNLPVLADSLAFPGANLRFYVVEEGGGGRECRPVNNVNVKLFVKTAPLFWAFSALRLSVSGCSP